MGKIDKDELYGQFNASAHRQARLQERIISKALDLPVPVHEGVNATSYHYGAGLLRTAALCVAMLGAGAAGVVGAGLVGLLAGGVDLGRRPERSAPAPRPMETQEYEVRFWADDGRALDLKEPANE